ncbi:hypothetical protein MTsPCn5_11790 [Croceitalea sp. MTPC5]|uniref:hypothetical protein n=1 Tax=Croceitalea sp. MTPC5 TaxID=3056565 RepID=UPI002B3D794E|nr:hypothetical protein MTsPCn5_11790 [Croceitalea sp. MTPC5]
MKTSTYFILILLIASGCSEDNTIDEESITDDDVAQLISRTITFYQDDILKTTTKQFFVDGKLSKSESSSGDYHLYTYGDSGRLEKIDYYAEGDELQTIIEYTYDAQGKMITRLATPISDFENTVPFERTYSYDEDHITGNLKFYDQNYNLVILDTITFNTNSVGLISKSEKLNDFQEPWGAEITYQNESPRLFEYYGWRTDFEGIVEYSYSEDINVGVYPIAKLMFGENWKNNMVLNDGSVLYHTTFGVLSNQYLTGYTYWNTEKTEIKENVTIDYEFDTSGKLIRKIYYEENLFMGRTYKYDTTYDYN